MNILFVCTGNTCRSCMAEAIFNQLCTQKNIKAFSAGVAIVKDSRTSSNTGIIVKRKYNVDIGERKAVQLTAQMIQQADLVLTMTSFIKDQIINALPQYKDKIHTLNQYVGSTKEIIDPYGGDMTVYSETFEMLKKNIQLLLKKVKEDTSIS